jgi:hypothetical protein
MVDPSSFEGWEDISAFETHVKLVRDHQENIARIAAIVGPDWLRGLITVFRTFLHPEVRMFEKDEVAEATEWLRQ